MKKVDNFRNSFKSTVMRSEWHTLFYSCSENTKQMGVITILNLKTGTL